MSENTIRAPKLTAAEEAELMEVFLAWFELFTAGDPDLADQAAWLFRQQVQRGGAWRAVWILVQDTLSNWWELPVQMREWLRTAPVHEGFAARAVRTAVTTPDTDDDEED